MTKEEKYFHIYSTSPEEGFWDTYDAVDAEGWSVRFVEKKEDGSLCLATELIQIGDTVLPEAAIKGDEIAEGYKMDEISFEEFESIWNEAVEYARANKLKPLLTGVIYSE